MKVAQLRIISSIVATLTLASCVTVRVESAAVGAATNAMLDAANTAFSAAYVSGDAETILAAYTQDAVIATPQGAVAATPAAIRAMWSPISANAAAAQRPEHHLAATDRRRLADGAILEIGRYDIMGHTREGEERWSRGCYTVVWRETTAGWRLSYDSWTAPLDPAPTCRSN